MIRSSSIQLTRSILVHAITVNSISRLPSRLCHHSSVLSLSACLISHAVRGRSYRVKQNSSNIDNFETHIFSIHGQCIQTKTVSGPVLKPLPNRTVLFTLEQNMIARRLLITIRAIHGIMKTSITIDVSPDRQKKGEKVA